jgi:hypothetical protein
MGCRGRELWVIGLMDFWGWSFIGDFWVLDSGAIVFFLVLQMMA